LNSGGEPERDDTGLPPVDIEIPDDARELDRDVQAYYREQRAFRRQQRRSLLHGFLAKDGIVLPLLACCLILALIAGTLLTVFTAAPDQGFQNLPGPGGQAGTTGTSATGPASPGAAHTGGPTKGGGSARSSTNSAAGSSTVRTAGPVRPILTLPDTAIQIDGKPVPLYSLSRSLLVLIPPDCQCAAAVTNLAQFATSVRAPAYLVSAAGNVKDAWRLARQVNSQPRGTIRVAVDTAGALGQYRHGLTAVLVGPRHTAAYAGHLVAGENLAGLRAALAR
jgi:hypothetical protein